MSVTTLNLSPCVSSSLVSVEGRAERGQRIMARRGFLTVTQDEVVQRVKPILCGKWLLKVSRRHPAYTHLVFSLQ